MKRRSSLRIKDIKFDYNSNSNTNKKIQWNIPEQRSENKKKSIKDTKTPYISYDGEEDIYLKKITEINRMDQTKAKLEEYAKKIENEYSSNSNYVDIASDEDTDISKNILALTKQYNSHQIKGSDINVLDNDSVNETIKKHVL